MTDKVLVIYHSGCDDGFAAAMVVRDAFSIGPNAVEFHAAHYQGDPPDVTGRVVILVDFSYKRPVLLDMATRARAIIVLDHHHTAAQDLFGFPSPVPFLDWVNKPEALPEGIMAEFDMARSGAGITWDYFNPGMPRPQFIDYIEDRDLWRKQLPGSEEFTSALRSYPQDFAVWDGFSINPPGVEALIKEGGAILRFYRQQVEKLKAVAYAARLDGHRVWISNAPAFMASEVAGELAAERECEFGATVYQLADGRWSYSLRSRGDFDVSEVAKRFGGGGHKGAAGFTMLQPIHARLPA